MVATIDIYDERPGRAAEFRRRFELSFTHTTAAEIIRLRVTAEVDALNAARLAGGVGGNAFATEAERTLNGIKQTRLLDVDVETEVERALQAFSRNAYFMFVDGRQITSLDQRIDVNGPLSATFLRLVPLVGG